MSSLLAASADCCVVAQELKLPITSKSIEECLTDTEFETIFLVKEFAGELFTRLIDNDGV